MNIFLILRISTNFLCICNLYSPPIDSQQRLLLICARRYRKCSNAHANFVIAREQ